MNRKKIKIRHDERLLCLSLNENGNLSLTVLKQYFPNAQALAYIDNGQKCGLYIVLGDIIINPAVDSYNVHIVEDNTLNRSEEKEYDSDIKNVFVSKESWIWLDVATSNNKPEIIAYYYLETVKKLQVLPTLIRSDHGTENCLVESLQQSLRFYHDDKFSGYKSFMKGKSTSNQRIESYWWQLRRHGLDFWICLFKDMRDKNIYDDSNYIDVECLRYCFGPLIKTDLEIIRRQWNRHRIRRQKNRRIPAGKPNCLFYLPEMIGMKNYKKPVDNDAIEICKTYYSIEPKLYTEDFHQLVQEILSDRVISPSIEDALEMYITISECIKDYQSSD